MKFVEYSKDDADIVRIKVDINEGGVMVKVLDGIGRRISTLLTITEKGIYLHKGINSDLGFALDEEGKLKVL